MPAPATPPGAGIAPGRGPTGRALGAAGVGITPGMSPPATLRSAWRTLSISAPLPPPLHNVTYQYSAPEARQVASIDPRLLIPLVAVGALVLLSLLAYGVRRLRMRRQRARPEGAKGVAKRAATKALSNQSAIGVHV